MVRGLRSVLGPASNENPSVVGLDRTESDRNHKVNIQNFPLLSLVVDVIKSDNLLVKFEEMDLIGPDLLNAGVFSCRGL